MYQKGLISVIMTNYNTPEDYLRQAIDSILCQTYSNFEFIIIDDCSTDNSVAVIESYTDERIRLFKNQINLGLTKSLNIALKKCNGEYIARMDSDDVSESNRFEKQIGYLQEHPNILVCGTWIRLIGDWRSFHSNEYLCREIPDRETFSIMQLFSNTPNIVHPTAMFNRKMLSENDITYNENYIYAQDYRMWISCNNCAECAIMPEVLLDYRVHTNAISLSRKEKQDDCVVRIIQEQLDLLHLALTDEIKPYHIGLLTDRKPYDVRIKSWIKQLISANRKYKIYNQKLLKKLLWEKWIEISYYGIRDRKTKAQAVKNLNVFCYPKLVSIYIKRKKGKNDG